VTVDPSAGQGFRADPSSLRSDAARWSDAALSLSEAAGAAEQLAIDANAFSYLANFTTGVDQTYTALQAKLTSLLHQGVAGFTDIAAALTATADTYANADQTTDEHVRGAGTPLTDLGSG